MTPIAIHALTQDDVDLAVGLLDAQLREHDISTPAAALREVVRAVIADDRHGFMYLAWLGDRAVGIAYAAAHLSAEHGGVIGWLEELYVAPECRGAGVGSLLLHEVISHAQQLNWRGIELEVVAGHERAAALYLRHGFIAAPRARYTRLFERSAAAEINRTA